LLDICEDSVATFGILPVLLLIVQPKRRVNADKYKEQFGYPAPNT
jgi:hypothetical protein